MFKGGIGGLGKGAMNMSSIAGMGGGGMAPQMSPMPGAIQPGMNMSPMPAPAPTPAPNPNMQAYEAFKAQSAPAPTPPPPPRPEQNPMPQSDAPNRGGPSGGMPMPNPQRQMMQARNTDPFAGGGTQPMPTPRPQPTGGTPPMPPRPPSPSAPMSPTSGTSPVPNMPPPGPGITPTGNSRINAEFPDLEPIGVGNVNTFRQDPRGMPKPPMGAPAPQGPAPQGPAGMPQGTSLAKGLPPYPPDRLTRMPLKSGGIQNNALPQLNAEFKGLPPMGTGDTLNFRQDPTGLKHQDSPQEAVRQRAMNVPIHEQVKPEVHPQLGATGVGAMGMPQPQMGGAKLGGMFGGGQQAGLTAPPPAPSRAGMTQQARASTFDSLPPRDQRRVALAALHEAHNQGPRGRAATVDTMFNRMINSGKSIKDILTPTQYSGFRPNIDKGFTGRDRFSEAQINNAMKQIRETPTNKESRFATHYHANYVSPKWARKSRGLRNLGQIIDGNTKSFHKFFVGDKGPDPYYFR